MCRRYRRCARLETHRRPARLHLGSERPWVDGVGIRLGSTVLVNGPFRRLPLTHVDSCADCVAQTRRLRGRERRDPQRDRLRRRARVASRRRADPRRRRDVHGDASRCPTRWAWGSRSSPARSRGCCSAWNRLPGILIPERYRARFRSLRFPNQKAVRAAGLEAARLRRARAPRARALVRARPHRLPDRAVPERGYDVHPARGRGAPAPRLRRLHVRRAQPRAGSARGRVDLRTSTRARSTSSTAPSRAGSPRCCGRSLTRPKRLLAAIRRIWTTTPAGLRAKAKGSRTCSRRACSRAS